MKLILTFSLLLLCIMVIESKDALQDEQKSTSPIKTAKGLEGKSKEVKKKYSKKENEKITLAQENLKEKEAKPDKKQKQKELRKTEKNKKDMKSKNKHQIKDDITYCDKQKNGKKQKEIKCHSDSMKIKVNKKSVHGKLSEKQIDEKNLTHKHRLCNNENVDLKVENKKDNICNNNNMKDYADIDNDVTV